MGFFSVETRKETLQEKAFELLEILWKGVYINVKDKGMLLRLLDESEPRL